MRYRIVSLGCPKNLVDSEYMAGRLEQAGHGLSDEADIVVINTCAFIADACSESIETILEESKRSAEKGTRLVVTGCLVERYGAELQKLLPEVDTFAARDSYGSIETIIEEKGFYGRRNATGSEKADPSPRKVLTPVPTAYLKIQEGCNNRCSYCTIPSIRGPLASRQIDEIEAELRTLLKAGYREINLIGQDTTSYGKDSGANIRDLLARLLSVEGDYFIRLLYMHPKGIDDELLDLMSGDDRIIKYLDIPVQHTEDRLLRSMNRGYSRRDIENLFDKIRKKMPDAVLRTTIMVGYPGETEEEFSNLCDFIREREFDNLGAFVYSREQGTPASRLKGHLPKGVKKKRYERIMELQKDISKRRLSKLIGRSLKVVVEAREADGTVGRLLLQAPDIDGIAFIRGDCAVGEIREGIVVGTLDYDVTVDVGEVVDGTDD
jgi:ribosomal protein S12 methylthiotransferase